MSQFYRGRAKEGSSIGEGQGEGKLINNCICNDSNSTKKGKLCTKEEPKRVSNRQRELLLLLTKSPVERFPC